ncbi:MAG: Stp1/IreP family PP2C-type Ser/Thr phosphatase [Lachnospiraceae bacterium]|jgi:protein phosphatase|nr:Stp1/IreP family PP2C-type Ser/Thr phosphatase [Lachnospiraceae bacterium]
MKTHALTDIGLTRAENQDCFYTSEMPVGNLPNLFIVADGMGGHVGGRCASHKALEAVIEYIRDTKETKPELIFRNAFAFANEEVMKEAKEKNLEGMGTTLVAATINDNCLVAANVGDSRLYVVSPGEIRQITVDHSWVEKMVRLGELEPDEARTHEKKNVITRAIGMMEELKVDVFEVPIAEEERILMCSDGLTNMIEDEQIRIIINSQRDVIERTEKLVETANQNGGKDNITVVVIEP